MTKIDVNLEVEKPQDDELDLYAKLCQVLLQLEEANKVIKWYDSLEKMLVGWELVTGQKKGTASEYLKKWSVQ